MVVRMPLYSDWRWGCEGRSVKVKCRTFDIRVPDDIPVPTANKKERKHQSEMDKARKRKGVTY